jgi:hypothetical protein
MISRFSLPMFDSWNVLLAPAAVRLTICRRVIDARFRPGGSSSIGLPRRSAASGCAHDSMWNVTVTVGAVAVPTVPRNCVSVAWVYRTRYRARASVFARTPAVWRISGWRKIEKLGLIVLEKSNRRDGSPCHGRLNHCRIMWCRPAPGR